MKKWTVMIYMGGDNNLSQDCVSAIKEMYRVGVKSDDIAVVVQFDPAPMDLPTYRYDIGEGETRVANDGGRKRGAAAARGLAEDGEIDQLGRPLLFSRMTYGRRTANTVERVASASEIVRFVRHVKERHKAENYMLVLSGHGSGAQGDALLMEGNPPSYISIARLGWALGEIKELLGKPLDIIGFDACAMNMAEVGYQLRDSARFLVGAEGFEKNSGWPYFRVLEILNADATISADRLAAKIVESYVLYYSDYVVAGVSVDLAACDLRHSEELANAVRNLCDELDSRLNNKVVENAVVVAHWRAQSYKFEEYVDLWDFCDQLEEAMVTDHHEILGACEVVKRIIANRYVLKSCYSGAAFQHSRGVSICLPWSEPVSRKYHELRFKETGWHRFIDKYVTKTRRAPRGADEAEAQNMPLQPFSLTLENIRLNHTVDDRANHTVDDRSNFSRDDRANFSRDDRANHTVDDRANHTVDDRANFTVDDRANHTLDDRSNFSRDDRANHTVDDRVDLSMDVRANHTVDDRVNHTVDDKGLAMLMATMKNPPVQFYEDECVKRARTANGVIRNQDDRPGSQKE